MIVHIIGTRPNFIKCAAVYRACEKAGLKQIVCYIPQHTDPNMSTDFAKELGFPIECTELSSNSACAQTGNVVIVYGDCNCSLFGAAWAKFHRLQLVHVEAGLRSGDMTMPEERNRKAIDLVSDVKFMSEPSALKHLQAEGLEDKAFPVGNVMIDTLCHILS